MKALSWLWSCESASGWVDDYGWIGEACAAEELWTPAAESFEMAARIQRDSLPESTAEGYTEAVEAQAFYARAASTAWLHIDQPQHAAVELSLAMQSVPPGHHLHGEMAFELDQAITAAQDFAQSNSSAPLWITDTRSTAPTSVILQHK